MAKEGPAPPKDCQPNATKAPDLPRSQEFTRIFSGPRTVYTLKGTGLTPIGSGEEPAILILETLQGRSAQDDPYSALCRDVAEQTRQ